jgi:holo-[acyl-carrier protein] synthase
VNPTGATDPWENDHRLTLDLDPTGVSAARRVAGAGIPFGWTVSNPTVVGVGIDVVAVERFAAALGRTPTLADRLFAPAEQVTASGHRRSAASLAARFAVKEAVAKALGVPAGMEWHDCSVVSEASGRPALAVTGTVAAACVVTGISAWRISLSHDAGIAAAIVIGLGAQPGA